MPIKENQPTIEVKGNNLLFNNKIACSIIDLPEDKIWEYIYKLQCSFKGTIEKVINISEKEKENILNIITNNPECIECNFMPIIDNKTGLTTKYEALARLNIGGKILSPFYFLPLIENTSLELKVSNIMLEKTINKLKNNPGIEIALNVSGNDISNDIYIKQMENLLTSNNIKKGRLSVELLETVKDTNNGKELNESIKAFNSFGVKVAIDDLGKGNSCIERLLYSEPKYITDVKIDGSIIQGLSDKLGKNETIKDKKERIKNAEKIISFIIQITKNKNPKQKVTAEYVTDKKILKKLIGLGVDYSQGYFFGEASKELVDKDKYKNIAQNLFGKKLKDFIPKGKRNKYLKNKN